MMLRHSFVLATVAAAALTACGGGGGDSTGTTTPPVDTNAYLTGTAASGAPMAGATITIQDASGKSVAITADAQGAYKAPITGFTAPLYVTATVPSGDSVRTYHAVVNVVITAGASSTANVTPLTDAIAAMASSSGNAPAEFADTAKLAGLSSARLKQAIDALKLIIKDVVTELGDASFDPTTSGFSADRASVGDKLLETVKVTISDVGVTLINARVPLAANDTGNTAAVTVKDIATAAPTALPKPTVTDSYTVFDPWVAQINKCLALPQAQRVSVEASGAPTAFLADCAQVTNFSGSYQRNGYTLLQYWGGQLSKWIPDGAVMETPEVLLFAKNDAGDDIALVRLSYHSAKGGGSYFETARKIAGVWMIDGNQRKYDATISPRISRLDDVSPNGYKPSVGPDAGKNVGNFSSYYAGLTLSFNQSGPNAASVYAVRVTGPGLPQAGAVMARSTACGTSDYLGFYSNNGTLPATPAAGAVPVLVTSSATIAYTLTVAPKGNGYTGTDFYNEWRGRNADGTPSTSPLANSAYPPVDLSTIPEFALYTFEVFKVGSAVAADTFKVRLVTRPVSPAYAAALPWSQFDADSLGYVDVANAVKAGALSTATLGWTLPGGAPPVVGGAVFGRSGTGLQSMNMDSAVAALGDTSLSLTAAVERDGNGKACTTTTVPAYTATSGMREIAMRQTLPNGLSMRQYTHVIGRPAI